METRTEQFGINLPTDTSNKSRGGLSDYSEINKKTVQRVRGDFLCPTYKPRITLALDSVTFNMSCVNLFPNDQHIVISVDEENQRIYVEPTMYYDRDGLKFAILKNKRNNPRKCMARPFCSMVYEMMGWHRLAKYRALAIFQEFGDKKIMVFNLDECIQTFTEVFESDDGKTKRKVSIIMPDGWRGRFGYSIEELEDKTRIDTTCTLITIDNKTGERHPSRIQAKLPTPEELMHRPYGGIRERREEDEDHG